MASPIVRIAKRGTFNEKQHPRDAHGRFIRVGDVVTTAGGDKGTVVGLTAGGVKLRTASGGTVTVKPDQVTGGKETSLTGMRPAKDADRKRLKIPPAWTDVLVNDAEDAKILAVGRDAKGREQRRYSAAHADAQAVAKFQRINRLVQELPHVDSQITSDAKTDDTAAALLLIRRLGLRVGSTRDTGADKQAYGATTLLSDHVQIDGDNVTLTFVGKKGVSIKLETKDPDIAAALAPRLKKAKPGQPLLATSDAQVRDYTSSLLPGFKPKDFRTLLATGEALEQVSRTEAPKDAKGLAAAKKAVAEHVSRLLGNTPNVALASYIDPTVFGRWEATLALQKDAHSREAALRAHYETTAYQTPNGLLVPIPYGDHLPDDGTPDDDEEPSADTTEKVQRTLLKGGVFRWIERLHPRGPDGRFAHKPYSSGSYTPPADNPDARRELGGLPKPKKYDGLDPYEAGKRHYETASPKRAAWLRRASAKLLDRLDANDPDREYWLGVAGLQRENNPVAPKPTAPKPSPTVATIADGVYVDLNSEVDANAAARNPYYRAALRTARAAHDGVYETSDLDSSADGKTTLREWFKQHPMKVIDDNIGWITVEVPQHDGDGNALEPRIVTVSLSHNDTSTRVYDGDSTSQHAIDHAKKYWDRFLAQEKAHAAEQGRKDEKTREIQPPLHLGPKRGPKDDNTLRLAEAVILMEPRSNTPLVVENMKVYRDAPNKYRVIVGDRVIPIKEPEVKQAQQSVLALLLMPPEPLSEKTPDPLATDDLTQMLAAFLVEHEQHDISVGEFDPEKTALDARRGDPVALKKIGFIIKEVARAQANDVGSGDEEHARFMEEHTAAYNESMAANEDLQATAERVAAELGLTPSKYIVRVKADLYAFAKGDPRVADVNPPEVQAAALRVVEAGKAVSTANARRMHAARKRNRSESDGVMKVVASIREMANPDDLQVTVSSPQVGQMLDEVITRFPKDWVIDSNDNGGEVMGYRKKPLSAKTGGQAGAGHYDSRAGEIVLGTLDEGLIAHEFAHRVEDTRLGVLAAEQQYFVHRTGGNITGAYMGRRGFEGNADKFKERYSGRVYRRFKGEDPYAFELLTTGVQQLVKPASQWDPDLTSWTLGMLVSL